METQNVSSVRRANANFAPRTQFGVADYKNLVDIVVDNDGNDLAMSLNLGGFIEAINQGIIKECKPFDEKVIDLCMQMEHLSVNEFTTMGLVKIGSKMVGWLEDKSYGLPLWGEFASLLFSSTAKQVHLCDMNFEDIMLFDCGTFRFEQASGGEMLLLVKHEGREEIRWCGRCPDAVLAEAIISQNPAFAIFVASKS